MPVPNFSGLPPYPTFEDVTDKVNKLVNELRNLLLNLDTLNISQLNADVVNAGTINSNLVTVHGEDGSHYFQLDGTGIVANNGTTNTLTFDLTTGLLTIVSALIQSASGYPRVELNSTNNLVGAYQTANEAISITPAGLSGNPILNFINGAQTKGFIQYLAPDLYMATSNGVANISISSGITLNLSATSLINMNCSNIRINNQSAYSGSFSYVKSATSDGAGGVITNYGTITVTNGIITNVT